EARKEENSFTYKLGQAIMNANKTWYKGGYVKLWFEIRKLKEKI
ncbi:alpha-2,3-sialyltransferase, partial [Campylobacter coli]|nr:alpha-2,3-sialyltransferase [Campylobacter coli]